MLRFLLAVLAAVAFSTAHVGSARADVLIIGAEVASWTNDIRQKIVDTGLVSGQIDVFDARTGTPSLAMLQGYDAVLVYSDFVFGNRNLLGNRLATYVDGGGGVVEAPFASNSSFYGLGGRWQSQGYNVWAPGSVASGTPLTLGPVVQPSHYLMQGVNSLDGGSGSWHTNVGALRPGAELVANWSNGQGLVAFSETRPGTVVGLNFFPVSSDVRSDFWDASSDGGRLLANALNFAGGARSVPEPTAIVLLSALAVAGWSIQRFRKHAGSEAA